MRFAEGGGVDKKKLSRVALFLIIVDLVTFERLVEAGGDEDDDG